MQPQALHDAFVLRWAKEFAVPALLVTLDLRFIWANASGHDLLAESCEIFLNGDILCFADKSQANDFRKHLSALNGTPSAWICALPNGSNGLFRTELIHLDGHPPVAAVMIFRPTAAQSYYWGDIGKLFGLTKAEVVVVKRMVAGESAAVMAEASNVSLETIRTHIRRIYNKMDVVGREELIATVSAYRTT